MRFYDPILHIVDLEISDDKKEFFYSKNQNNLENFKKTNFKQMLKDKFFGSEKERKMTFKHAIVNQKEFNQIDHYESEHTQHVQRSKYLIIDNDVEDLL